MSAETLANELAGWPAPADLVIQTLGTCRYDTPLGDRHEPFVDDAHRVLLCADMGQLDAFLAAGQRPPTFEPAGPRQAIFFDSARITCAILTCGGLCPGLNNVVRSIVLRLTYGYGVREILGFRWGYSGLSSHATDPPVVLTPAMVDHLHEQGGTLLGSSRGPQDVGHMVDTLVQRRVSILFVLGGDGGLRGAAALSQEITRRGLSIGVIGVPKTIDNDLQWTVRSFGFATAVDAARTVLQAAHVEARAAWNGVALVKLMGRHSGFIAAHATLASSDVNFCLVPEVPFGLDGPRGFLAALEQRIDAKSHALIVVAEGAGQELLQDGGAAACDASGNAKLKDIGVFLRDRIAAHFASRAKEVTMRYIDPSYIIRSQPASSLDATYCLVLGQHAVHAGMAGRTNMVVGAWNNRFVHIPIPLAVARRREIDPRGEEWQRVLETTGQPDVMG